MDERGHPHLIDHGHAVVGGRAIRSDGNTYTGFDHFRNLGETKHTHGRGRVVRHFDLVIGKHLDFAIGQPDGVHCQEIFIQDSQVWLRWVTVVAPRVWRAYSTSSFTSATCM